MFTVGILFLAVFCRMHTLYASDKFAHGLIYAMRGLSALSVLTVGQCEGLGTWDRQQANPTLFFLR